MNLSRKTFLWFFFSSIFHLCLEYFRNHTIRKWLQQIVRIYKG